MGSPAGPGSWVAQAIAEQEAYLDRAGAKDWAVIACDDDGMTTDAAGPDPEALANKVAPWAQQEADKWPHLGLIYMLVTPEEAVAVEDYLRQTEESR